MFYLAFGLASLIVCFCAVLLLRFDPSIKKCEQAIRNQLPESYTYKRRHIFRYEPDRMGIDYDTESYARVRIHRRGECTLGPTGKAALIQD